MANPELKVFISHQWRDKQQAERLADELGHFAEIWMDYRNLKPGDSIQDEIDQALADMDIMLLLWTPHAASSHGVQAEIATAHNLGLRLVPCILSYDESGYPAPPLPSEIENILGVDFHHFGSGVAQLTELIHGLQRERLPQDVAPRDDPRVEMLNEVRGLLNYLANYRKLAKVDDNRQKWVERTLDRIETCLLETKDWRSAFMLLEAAKRSVSSDPEGLKPVLERMESVLAQLRPDEDADTPVPNVQKPDRKRTSKRKGPGIPRPAEAQKDELEERLRLLVPEAQVPACLELVHAYISCAPHALNALTEFAQAAASPAGVQVTHSLQQYLDQTDDLIPDHMGAYGALDDAWLILNTAFRLIESGLVPVHAMPINWQIVSQADPLVVAVMPPPVGVALEQHMWRLLGLIAAEAQTYEPMFETSGRGYAPTVSGGCWEDIMNDGLLGTGLSAQG